MGYVTIDGSEFVSDENALRYVLEKCGVKVFDITAPDAEEFKAMIVEWYFSGNWVRVDD